MKEIDLFQAKHFPNLPEDARLRLAVILILFAWSRSTLYRRISSGDFPKPEFDFGDKVPRWKVSTIRKVLAGNTLEQVETENERSSSFFNKQPQQQVEVASEVSKNEQDLVFPTSFSDAEILVANKAMFGFPDFIKQQLLDEVEGNIRAKTVRKSGLTLLLHLAKLAKKGTFVPSVGLAIQKERDAKNRLFKPTEPKASPLRDPKKLEQRRNEMRQALQRKPRKPRK